MLSSIEKSLFSKRQLGKIYGITKDDSGEYSSVVALYDNNTVLIESEDDSSLATLSEKYLSQATTRLTLLGRKSVIDIAASAACLKISSKEEETIYYLNREDFRQNLNCQIELRLATISDWEIVFKWYVDYLKEAYGDSGQRTSATLTLVVKEIILSQSCWLGVLKNRAVSMLAFNAKFRNWCQIGPVWTPPKYRNRGYASELINLVIYSCSNLIQHLVLFTSNPLASKAYQKSHFAECGSMVTLHTYP